MRTRKTVVILISGKAGSGKTTVAGILEKKLTDIPSITTFKYGFAEPIKYIAKAYFGWEGEKDEKGRKLLQQLGAVGREYDENLWVKHFLNQLDKRAGLLPFNFSVIDDWRFPNEIEYLRNNPLLDIVTFRIYGRGGLKGKNAEDVSENSLPEGVDNDELYDFVIANDTSLEDLDEKLDTVMASIKEKYVVE